MKIRLAGHESEKESELSNLRLQNLRGNIRLADLEQKQVFTKGLKTLVRKADLERYGVYHSQVPQLA